jgi:hypothetical protein
MSDDKRPPGAISGAEELVALLEKGAVIYVVFPATGGPFKAYLKCGPFKAYPECRDSRWWHLHTDESRHRWWVEDAVVPCGKQDGYLFDNFWYAYAHAQHLPGDRL